MSKENLTESGFEPETSDLTYQRSDQLSYPALYWGSPRLSTIFAQVGVRVKPEVLGTNPDSVKFSSLI